MAEFAGHANSHVCSDIPAREITREQRKRMGESDQFLSEYGSDEC